MGSLEAALAAIESLAPGESINYSEIARNYGVERSTLRRRHQARTQSRATEGINRRKLSPQQEKELISYIKKLTERGLPPTRAMIQNFAGSIAGTTVSMWWVDQFIKRNNSELILHWTTGMDSKRHNADLEAKYSLYFSLLQQKINKYSIQPRYTYNMDEKGILLGIITRTKRIFSRQEYERKAVRQAIQDGNRECISILACICADGSALDPALIYEAGLEGLLLGWIEDINPEEYSAFITSSLSSWINNEIGLTWLEQVFNRCIKEKAGRLYRLLIVDGHRSYVTMDFLNYCDWYRILVAVFPPYSTHTLQPLDACIFKPLSTTYLEELLAFLYKGQGLCLIAKRDFFNLF